VQNNDSILPKGAHSKNSLGKGVLDEMGISALGRTGAGDIGGKREASLLYLSNWSVERTSI